MQSYIPHEFKVQCVRECEPMTELLDTPDQIAAYWRQNIPKADWYDPMKEALVVLVLNTRKRIIGHNLVALGGLDTCPVVPLFVFRPVLAVAGSCVVLVHNHPSGVIPHPVLCRMAHVSPVFPGSEQSSDAA
jgi:DNA repair protein RadC